MTIIWKIQLNHYNNYDLPFVAWNKRHTNKMLLQLINRQIKQVTEVNVKLLIVLLPGES